MDGKKENIIRHFLNKIKYSGSGGVTPPGTFKYKNKLRRYKVKPMREIQLIKNTDYNYRYYVIDEKNNVRSGDNVINDTVSLSRKVYTADEVVDLESKEVVDNVKNNFIETFKNRGGATKEQIYFAEETAKVIFGKLKESVVITIPAPCGFGKSSISLEILKELIKLIKENKTTDGLILVTDRLDSLRNTENDLNELNLSGYTYILEGWNEDLCDNKKVKDSNSKMCTPQNCPYFYKCKIYEQQEEQNKFPILMITNARLRECGDSIKRYSKYENGERKILLIDERPDILDTVKVNKKLLNEISTEISKCKYEDTNEKTEFENLWNEIQSIITNKMQKLRSKYKRFIVSNVNNEPICKNDTRFMELWDKYMQNNYKRELNHIHRVLTQGGFYVYQSNVEFITTIGSKDLKEMYEDTFKTIIFDGTALYDPLYLGMHEKGSLKFLDIENTRLYSNLYINAYIKHKLTRQTFKEISYLAKACGNFIKDKLKVGFNKKVYVVSYQSVSVQLADVLKKVLKNKSTRISMLNENECYYFGNTKGKNNMQDCNVMFQLGWDTIPDYEYVIKWLSVSVDWDGTIELCSKLENAEKLSEYLEMKDRSQEKFGTNTYKSDYPCWEFGLQKLNHFKMFSLVTNFYQEVHRTKLRSYNCTKEKIEVHLFAQRNIIFDMIEQLFPKCNMNPVKDKLSCFKFEKKTSRKNKDGTSTIPQKIINWIENVWNGNEIKTKDMLKSIGITQKQFDKSKENDKDLKELLNKYMVKRGIYKKAF